MSELLDDASRSDKTYQGHLWPNSSRFGQIAQSQECLSKMEQDIRQFPMTINFQCNVPPIPMNCICRFYKGRSPRTQYAAVDVTQAQ